MRSNVLDELHSVANKLRWGVSAVVTNNRRTLVVILLACVSGSRMFGQDVINEHLPQIWSFEVHVAFITGRNDIGHLKRVADDIVYHQVTSLSNIYTAVVAVLSHLNPHSRLPRLPRRLDLSMK